jgi:hypothetical protein
LRIDPGGLGDELLKLIDAAAPDGLELHPI